MLLVCLLLGGITAGLYWPVFRSEFINFDDEVYVAGNEVVRSGLTLRGLVWAFATGHSANWHPLTWLSHMLDCQVFGLNPLAHHGTNLLFHALNTMLVFWILRSTTGTVWRSAFVAGLFGLHPIHVESVAWISERKDVLSTCLGLLAIWAYAFHVKAEGRMQEVESRVRQPVSRPPSAVPLRRTGEDSAAGFWAARAGHRKRSKHAVRAIGFIY